MSAPRALLFLIVAHLAVAARPARAACSSPTTPDEVARHLSSADVAFAELDADAFTGALGQARSAIPCLDRPLTAGQAAAWHRAEAFQAFLERDHATVVQHFRAMLAASPGYRLSEDIAPEGHPLRIDFEIAQGLPAEPTRELPAPREGVLRVDGRLSTQAPRTLPYLLQQVDEQGRVLVSATVASGSTMDVYPAKEGTARAPGKESGGKKAGIRGISVPLVAAAVVSGGTSAALYGLSQAKVEQFWDPATPVEADGLARLQRQANTSASLSLGLGLVAAGTGTAAVLSFVW